MWHIFWIFVACVTHFLWTEECQETEFISQPWTQRVYLATYPRSGNHWMRYLIEEATHIATSSVYQDPDPPHLPTPFPWGGYSTENGYEGNCRLPQPHEPVIIKTHFPSFPSTEFDKQPFVRVIRIIRHPVDSIYSFYLYAHPSKEDKMTEHQLRDYINSWRKFHEYWDFKESWDFNSYILTIRYEDLMNNPSLYLKKILTAIGYSFTEDDIQRAIQKFPPIGKELKHLHHFDSKDLTFIQNELHYLLEKYEYDIPIHS